MTDDAKSLDNSEDGRDKAIRDVSLTKVKFSFNKRFPFLSKTIYYFSFFLDFPINAGKRNCGVIPCDCVGSGLDLSPSLVLALLLVNVPRAGLSLVRSAGLLSLNCTSLSPLLGLGGIVLFKGRRPMNDATWPDYIDI